MLPRPQVAHVGRKLQLGVVHEGAGDGKPVPPGSVLGATQEEAAGSADVKPPPTALGSVLFRLDSTAPARQVGTAILTYVDTCG